MSVAELVPWLESLVEISKIEARGEGNKRQYLMPDGSAPVSETPVQHVHLINSPDFIPPRTEWPDWVKRRVDLIAEDRDRYADENQNLKKRLEELEQKQMTDQRELALAQYGEPHALQVVKERVALAPYGANLDDRGRAMVAQIAYMLDWNPFFDMHAFASKGKLVIMPDYKKLLSMVREQQRINYRERPMTSKEREQWGIKDGEIAFAVEITEVDIFMDYAKNGVADQYNPVLGIGIWRPGDNIPATWTAEMVAKKRGLRNGLSQLASYKIVTDRFRAALQGAGLGSAEETEDGFTVELPAETGGIADYWNDNPQRQRFWIEMGKLGYDKKSDVAQVLNFKINNPNDSKEWAKHMNQFPDLENALAYARVCVENAKQQDGQVNEQAHVIDGEVIEDKPAPGAGPAESIPDIFNSGEPPLWVITDEELGQLIKEAAEFWGTTSKTTTRKNLVKALGLNGEAKNDTDLVRLISSAYHGDYGTAMQAVTLHEVE